MSDGLEHLARQVATDEAAERLQQSIDDREATQAELLVAIGEAMEAVLEQVAKPGPGTAALAAQTAEAVATYQSTAEQLALHRAEIRRWHATRGYPAEPPSA